MTEFRPLDERTVFTGYILRVAVASFVAPDGTIFERDIVRHPGAVAVVPIDGEEVVLVRQYRAAIDAHLLEIPAGLRDIAGEALEDTARRELLEETGLVAGRLEKVAGVHNSVGFSDEMIHIFLATELSETDRTVTESPEEIDMEILRVPLAAAPELIASGEITDAKTVIGLLAALRR